MQRDKTKNDRKWIEGETVNTQKHVNNCFCISINISIL